MKEEIGFLKGFEVILKILHDEAPFWLPHDQLTLCICDSRVFTCHQNKTSAVQIELQMMVLVQNIFAAVTTQQCR